MSNSTQHCPPQRRAILPLALACTSSPVREACAPAAGLPLRLRMPELFSGCRALHRTVHGPFLKHALLEARRRDQPRAQNDRLLEAGKLRERRGCDPKLLSSASCSRSQRLSARKLRDQAGRPRSNDFPSIRQLRQSPAAVACPRDPQAARQVSTSAHGANSRNLRAWGTPLRRPLLPQRSGGRVRLF